MFVLVLNLLYFGFIFFYFFSVFKKKLLKFLLHLNSCSILANLLSNFLSQFEHLSIIGL